jgi:uncharacterized protein
MDKSTVMALLRRHADVIKGFGATSLYIFGSTVRGEAKDESDIDLFIDYDKQARFSLIELVALKHYLEEILHHPADVTTRDSLHPRLRQRILAEAEQVF